jgi:hypothetical protein
VSEKIVSTNPVACQKQPLGEALIYMMRCVAGGSLLTLRENNPFMGRNHGVNLGSVLRQLA